MDDTITMDRLFRFSKAITLSGRPLVIRAASSLDLRAQYDQALLATLPARRELRDKASDRYQLTLGVVTEAASDDELRSLLELSARNLAAVQAAREIKPEFVPLPTGATDEEAAQVLELRQGKLAQVAELRQTFIERRGQAERERVADLAREKLVADYVKVATQVTVDNVFAKAYDDAGLVAGVRNPDGTPYLGSLAEAAHLADPVRQTLILEMRSVNDLDPLAWSGPSSTATPPVPGA